MHTYAVFFDMISSIYYREISWYRIYLKIAITLIAICKRLMTRPKFIHEKP